MYRTTRGISLLSVPAARRGGVECKAEGRWFCGVQKWVCGAEFGELHCSEDTLLYTWLDGSRRRSSRYALRLRARL